MDPLHAAGPATTRAQIETVAKELEGVFMRTLLSHARSAGIADENGLFARSGAVDQFEELLHGELADRAAGGLGIADMVVDQLASRLRVEKGSNR